MSTEYTQSTETRPETQGLWSRTNPGSRSGPRSSCLTRVQDQDRFMPKVQGHAGMRPDRCTSSTGYLIPMSPSPVPALQSPSRHAGHHPHPPPTPHPSCDGEPLRRLPPTVPTLLISHCPLPSTELQVPRLQIPRAPRPQAWPRTRSGPSVESDQVQVLSRFRSRS